MKQNQMKYFSSVLSVVLSGIVSVAYAANPASKQYVDEKAASLQTQINAIQSNPANTLKIGQYYQGGVIFYLDNTVTPHRGLLVAINDATYGLSANCTSVPTSGSTGQNGGCYWQSPGANVTTGAQLTNYFTGQQNTQTILASSGGQTNYPAAYVAHQYSTSQDPSGAYWYLPAQSELMQMWSVVTQINTTIATIPGGQQLPVPDINGPNDWVYWSSTEFAGTGYLNDAWYVDFTNGNVGGIGKDFNQYGVRPVRAFNY